MSLIQFIHQGPTAEAAQLIEHDFFRSGPAGTIYSGVKFDDDGNIYARQTGGGWSSLGAWLLNGANTGFFVKRNVDSGTLTTDGGAGPIVLSSDRIYDVQISVNGIKTTTVSFEISNDVSGSPILAMITHVFTAEKESFE